MMLVAREPEEVQRWFLAFHMKQRTWWGERFIPGRFSHVSAFAFLPKARSWVLIDFSPRTGSHVAVFPLNAEDETLLPPGLTQWTLDSSILKADVRRIEDWRPRWGLWCVTAVKQLIGSSSRALHPEGLWRDLTKEGAEVVWDGFDEGAESAARSRADRADGAGPERAAESRPVVA